MRQTVTGLVAAFVAVGTLALSSLAVRADGGGSGITIPNPCDFITGGGFILTDTMNKANFGAHGGCKHGSFWGHVNYVDHGGYMARTPFHVSSTEITAYFMDLPNARTICGKARTNLNQDEVLFRVRMEDNDPTAPDMFEMQLSNGYFTTPAKPLIGGSIKLHKQNPQHLPPAIDPEDLPDLCPGLVDEDPPICPLPNEIPDGQGGCVCAPGFGRNEDGVCVPFQE